MWGDRIKNMRSAIEKVADVVAPPIEDSEDFDEDNDNVEDEDYLDFGDEDDIGSEEDDQDYNVTSDGGGIGAFKGPFGKGMAGMLSRVSDAVAPPGEGIDGSEEFSSSSEFVGTQNTKRAPFGKGGVVGMLSRVSDAVTTGGAGAGDSEQLEESEEFFSGQLEPDSSSAMKSHSGKGIVESMLPLVSDVVAPPIEKEDDFQGATASEELGTFATGEFMSEELTSEEFVSEELGSPIQQQQPTFKSGEPAVIDTAATTENEYDSSMLAAAAQSEFGRAIDDKEDSSSRDHVEESVTRVTTPPPVETDEAHNITPPKRESGTVGPSYRVPTKSISDLGMQSCTGTTELNAHSSVQSETNTPDTEEARVLRARSCSSSLSTIVPDFNALDSNAHDGKGDADPVLPSRQSSKDFVDEDVNIGETVDNNSNSAPSNGEMRFESGDHAVCNTRPPITPVRYVSEASDLANMLTQDTAVPVAASTVASAADTNLAEQEVNADLGDDAPDCKDSRTSPKYQLVPNGWFPPDAANKSMLKPPVQKETPLAIKTRRKLEEDCKTQKGTHSKLTSNPEASPQRRKKKRTPKINAKGNNKNNETTLAESVPTTEVGDTAATTPSITTISETAQNKSPEVIESEQKYSPEDDGQQKPSVSDASAEQPKPQLSTLTNSTFAEASTIAAASTNASEPPSSSPRDTKRIEELEAHCLELQQQLREAENQIVSVQQQAAQQLKQEEKNRELMLQNFQEKEARVLGASMEDHKQEMDSVRNEMEASLTMMRHQMEREQEAAHREQEQMEQLLEEANKRVKAAELESHAALSHHESEASQQQKLQNRALRMAEDKLAQTMAVLDEREEQCQKLQATVKASQSKIKEQVKSLRESEEELDELHNENETLERQVTELQGMVSSLQGDSEKLSGLKMELRMMKEDLVREQKKNKSAASSAESNSAQLEVERSAALASARDLEQQLAAALADVEVARADSARIMTANDNLQSALESFQNEREAELGILEEQRSEMEQATAAAHAAALDALREANDANMQEIQMAADKAVKNSMDEIKLLEDRLERYRVDNSQMRRSLDEAIHRLQTTDEDVIDRQVMKNILLDWLTKQSVGEKRQVLEVMASVLHFSQEEKDRVHISDGKPQSTLGAVVGAVAAPLPPAHADMEHLQGDTAREKWVDFLMQETE